MDYYKGWNDAIDRVIERMKNNIIQRLERHSLMSSTYIIDKIAADEYIKLMEEFKELKMTIKLKWKSIKLLWWELCIHRLEFRDGNEYQFELRRRDDKWQGSKK